jgi:fumarylacetoacetase
MRKQRLSHHRLSTGSSLDMYWTAAQILTHHASNGCNLNPGDLLGTGTVSSANREGFGSLLELTEGGTRPVDLPSGERRRFLEDGDEIVLRARARREGYISVAFGECRAEVIAAVPVL